MQKGFWIFPWQIVALRLLFQSYFPAEDFSSAHFCFFQTKLERSAQQETVTDQESIWDDT